jgi:type IV secretory pathway TraG/TraD family ATPase VirD4
MIMGFIKEQNNTNDKLQIPVDFKHCIILGETGSGKTSSVINPLLLDRMKRNHGILIFDFKGNYHYVVKTLAKQEGKLSNIIELGKIYGSYANIIEDLPLEAVSKILRNLLNHRKDDKFWEDSAVELAKSILGIIYYMNELTNNNCKYKYNFKTLIEIAKNAKNIKKFKKEIIKFANDFFKKSYNSYELNLINLLLEEYESLDSIADDDTLEKMIEDNEKNPLNSVIISLINPITSLKKDIVNINEINILEELNKGKIIIASLNDFDENVLNAIVESIFYQIYYFKIDNPDSKISIFMDEAQKIINNNFELPLDVLREYKVEVILATQSIANLKEKVDHNKIDALLANLVHKIYLNGKDKEVPKYEAFYNEKYYKLNPINIDNSNKFLAEITYQKNYSKLKNLPFNYKGIPVVYSRYTDTKLTIKNMELKSIGKTKFFPKNISKNDLLKKYTKLLKSKTLTNNPYSKYFDAESYENYGNFDEKII